MIPICTRAYYILKPLMPRDFQIFLRRRLAYFQRNINSNRWPIDPQSAKLPANWRGWPSGRQFAFILSHDVDTREGYDNVLELADLEEGLGFRSTFNFVPERYGKISSRLIDELKNRGFGVGVHGIKHDGKLYFSNHEFRKRAKKINSYLRNWNSKGFSSPSMHHKLEWLKDLDIDYSISTFDTDPFEPQPDGVGTIFPIWIRNDTERLGHVELPYTLPQDSTLFIILQEKNIDIWKRKVDWIAAKGGMALVNTHPDYMSFRSNDYGARKYPVQLYVRLLRYVKEKKQNQFYHDLASNISGFWRDREMNMKNSDLRHNKSTGEISPSGVKSDMPKISAQKERGPEKRKHKRVAMLAYAFYESDNRVRRYAETLVRRGDTVDVFTLRREKQGKYGELHGVRIHRIQERVRNEKGKFSYLSRIVKYLIRSFFALSRMHLKNPYDVVHVHSVPDFEVFAAIIPKITGSKIILDIHDIVPELYASKFNVKRQSIIFKGLLLAEKLSIAFADHIIISNDIWKRKLCSRSVSQKKCTSIINYPDDRIFYESNKTNNNNVVFLYPGTLNYHQGLDIAIKAFNNIKDKIPSAEMHIVGDGPSRDKLMELVADLDLKGRVIIKDPVPLDEIAKIMSNATIGIVPKRNDDFGGEAFSTKTLEFMICGVPIILSRTKIDQLYFNDTLVEFFEPENIEDLTRSMLRLVNDNNHMKTMRENALVFAKNYSWKIKSKIYLELFDNLTGLHT